MRKFLSVILACCMLFALTACNTNEVAEPSDVQSEPTASGESEPVSSENEVSEEVSWADFSASMAEQGITEGNLHTLENLGYPQNDIKKMSAEEIKKIIDDLENTLEQNKADFAKEILADIAAAQTDGQIVFTDFGLGTANFDRVTEAVKSIKANEHASFIGFTDSSTTMPYVYEIAHTPDGETTFTKYYYMSKDDFKTESYTVTDIYECESFIQFTDEANFRLSIPNVQLWGKNLIQTHKAGTPEGAITTDEAKRIAVEAENIITSYIAYAEENKLAKPFELGGIIIPEDFKAEASAGDNITADVEKTLFNINGKIYYKVSTNNGKGGSYYINAQKGETIFTVEQVNGCIIPLAYKGYEHTKLKTAG